MDIKFIPSELYFVCCKVFSVLIKIKWYCQVEGFLLRFQKQQLVFDLSSTCMALCSQQRYTGCDIGKMA